MITVLDFTTNEVHTYHVPPHFDWGNVENFIAQRHSINNCEYMTSGADQEPIQFYTHEILTA